MATYFLSSKAEADLFEIWEYRADNGGADSANSLIDILTATCQTLAGQPQIGTPRDYLPVGVLAFPKEGFMIFYRQAGSNIEIARIVDGRRHMPRLFGVD